MNCYLIIILPQARNFCRKFEGCLLYCSKIMLLANSRVESSGTLPSERFYLSFLIYLSYLACTISQKMYAPIYFFRCYYYVIVLLTKLQTALWNYCDTRNKITQILKRRLRKNYDVEYIISLADGQSNKQVNMVPKM